MRQSLRCAPGPIRSRTALVPTLSTLFSVLELGETLNLMPKQREEMAVNKDHWLSAVARARELDIPIAAGSDIGNRYPHGRNAREIEFLVRAGLSPVEALKAAIGTAARILGKRGTIGALIPGAFADLVSGRAGRPRAHSPRLPGWPSRGGP